MKDTELRGIILNEFYRRRRERFIPNTDDFDIPISEDDMFAICEQLKNNGLIDMPIEHCLGGEVSISDGKITTFGIDVVEGVANSDIKIEFVENNVTNNFAGATISNSNVNLGDNSALTYTIQKLPAENSELKVFLTQLQTLINNSSLLESDKKEALTEIQTIAQISTQPKEQNKNLVRKSLSYVKDLLSTDLGSVTEFLEVAEKIKDWF